MAEPAFGKMVRTQPAVSPLAPMELADEIHREIARYASVSPAGCAVEPVAPSPAATEPAPPAALPQPLSALLQLDGAAFVTAAYATLLGRAPDADGMAYHAAERAAGRSKVLLLWGLQRSPEARQRGARLPGLRRRYFASHLYRLPVVGPAARLVGAALRHTGLSRRIGPRDGLALLRAEFAGRLAAAEARNDAAQAAMTQQQAAMEGAARRIATVQAAQEQFARKMLASLAEQSRALAELTERQAALGRRVAVLEEALGGAVVPLPSAPPRPAAPQEASWPRRENLLLRGA